MLTFTKLYAQKSYDLTGTIIDHNKKPISFATILAKPVNEKYNMVFCSTNDDGDYKLSLFKNIKYKISVNMLGFIPYSYTYIPNNDFNKIIILKEDITQLDEVVIKIKVPIITKKDTIIYRVDQFTNGDERKLKHIMEKLPGLTVGEDGTITSQGKKVTHFLVENKSFFGGGSKLGVENIPANAVEKVEVIDDYNEIAFLKGMTSTDNMAVNIKLKKDKKNFLFGDLEAGKGNKKFYKAQSNLFYYKPNLNINFIGGANNIGKGILRNEDYKRFVDSKSVFNKRDIAEGNILRATDESNDVIKSRNTTGALNITKDINEKVSFLSYFIFSDIKNIKFNETRNQYLFESNNLLEKITNSEEAINNIGIGKLRLKFKPNQLEEWSFNSLLKYENKENDDFLSSFINDDNQLLKNNNGLKDINYNTSMEWHKRLSKKHAFSSILNIVYIKNNSESIWNTNRAISDKIIPLDSTKGGFYDLLLFRKNEKLNFNTVFKDYWNVGKSTYQTTLGNYHKKHKFISIDNQILENGTINNFNENNFGNNVDLNFNDFYLGINHIYKLGNFQFNQSLFLHNYSWQISQNTLISQNKWVLLPEISIRTGAKDSVLGFFRLDSNLNSSFSDIKNLANNFYLQSYNSIFRGNENLENVIQHSTTLNYLRSSLLKSYNFIGALNYTYSVNGNITNAVVNENLDRLIFPIELHEPNNNLTASVLYNKSKNNFKYNIRGKLSYKRSSQKINNIITNYRNNSASYNVSMKTLFKKIPDIELGLRQKININIRRNTNFTFLTTEPYFSFNYRFFNTFRFKVDYSYYNYFNKNMDISNTFSLTNLFLNYGKSDNPWSFRFSINNAFDVKFKNQNSFNGFIISDKDTFILPRIIMGSVFFKI